MTMASWRTCSIAVDHGDGQGKNQSHEASHAGPGHNDNFSKAFGAPRGWGSLRPASQTMVNQMRRTRMATSATRAPSAKRLAIREGRRWR